jgi:NADPH:quinone reductase-like Zn-dependent oxidoreductase
MVFCFISTNLLCACVLLCNACCQALMEAKPVQGQRVLVFAAAGGVGHVAVQLAKSLGLFTVGVTGPKNLVRTCVSSQCMPAMVVQC